VQNVEKFDLTFCEGCGIMESGCRLSRRPATLWDNHNHGRKFLFYWKIGKGYYLDIPSRLRSKRLAQDFGYKKE
jgi:hypothetical protein